MPSACTCRHWPAGAVRVCLAWPCLLSQSVADLMLDSFWCLSLMRSTWGVVTSNIRVVEPEGLNICWVKCIPIHQPFAPGSTNWSVSVKSPVRRRLWEAYFSHPRIFMVLPCLSSVMENSCFLSCWLGRRAWVTLVLKLCLLWSSEASVMTSSFKCG